MEPTTLFYILITILLIKYVLDTVLNDLNAKHFNDTIPSEVYDVYEIDEYQKSQSYKKTNHNFSKIFIKVIVVFFHAKIQCLCCTKIARFF